MAFTKKRVDVAFGMQNGAFGSGGSNSKTLTDKRVSAKIINAGGDSMGQLQCVIYGMTLSDMNQLSTVGTQILLVEKNTITLSAGDDVNGVTEVFRGTISFAYVDAQSQPEVGFRVTAHAGLIEAVTPAPPTSVSGSADVVQTMQQIAQQMGLQFENNGVSTKIANPYLPGAGRQQAQALARAAGVEWVIERGVLAIWPPGQARQGTSTIVSPQTGMRAYPAFNQSGVIVQQLFDYAKDVKMGGQITVQSQLTPACGDWTINTLEYDLEAQVPNGKWFVTMFASRINATPTPVS